MVSCRSVPKESRCTEREESSTDYRSVLLQEEGKQRRDSTVLHWLLDAGEDWIAGTYSVRYDTSSPLDSGRSRHPILEESYIWASGQKKSRMEGGAKHRSIETTETTITGLEEAAQRQAVVRTEETKPGKDPYRWRYILAGIVLLVFLIWRMKGY